MVTVVHAHVYQEGIAWLYKFAQHHGPSTYYNYELPNTRDCLAGRIVVASWKDSTAVAEHLTQPSNN